jgi:SAM-dependent methyltransferase
MDLDQLKTEVAALAPWHHDIEIVPGVRTGDPALAGAYAAELGKPTVNNPHRDMEMLVGDLFPNGLDGRSFLDCACNAGGHAFAARALGAGRIYGFDAREHWIRQAQLLARYLPSDDMSFETKQLEEIKGGEAFDLTLFRGIFYHLPDPVAGLKIAADRTRELIVVNTSGRPGHTPCLQLNIEDDVEVMSGVDRLAWLPTGPEVVQDILAWCGFPHSRVRFNWQAANGWSRMEVIGAREPGSLAHYDATEHEIAKYGTPARPPARAGLLRRLLGRPGA